MTIPIANVYYLLLYAWKHVQKKALVPVDAVPHTELCDLFGDVIATEASRQISRGLGRDYVTLPVVVAGIRGKLDLSTTIRRQLLPQARTQCDVDDLRHDVLRNRVIKATLRNLVAIDRLQPVIRNRLRDLYARLDDVSELRLQAVHFRLLQSHHHAREYDFLLKLCRLVFDHTMIDPAPRRSRFHDFREDDATMWKIFEQFVFEFFRLEQRAFTVSRPHIEWRDAQGSASDLEHLPKMQPDVILASSQRSIIIDAKFYEKALGGRFGGDRVNSANLYQLLSYLDNRAPATPGAPQEGMLLYPVVDGAFAYTYKLNGKKIMVRSIDLAQPWACVHQDMLDLVTQADSPF